MAEFKHAGHHFWELEVLTARLLGPMNDVESFEETW